MLDKINIIKISQYDWSTSIPIYRYVFGISFILLITTLMNYELSYLTTVLALGYIAPGVKPITFKAGVKFIVALGFITTIAVIFSAFFLDYPWVFLPLLCLSILWVYYTDKLASMIKLFSLVSILVIPIISLESGALGNFVAISLVFNAFMAVSLSQLVYIIFPYADIDATFAKAQQKGAPSTEYQRFRYAIQILIILFPLLLLFFLFKLSGSLLILIFISILSMSPALANAKIGKFLIVANILGGVFAILAFKLLTIVPLISFMLFLTIIVGFIAANKLFSKAKAAAIYGSAFSTFLLILGSVTSSDSTAGDKVWTRVVQIAIAVIYTVIAFNLMNRYKNYKKKLSDE